MAWLCCSGQKVRPRCPGQKVFFLRTSTLQGEAFKFTSKYRWKAVTFTSMYTQGKDLLDTPEGEMLLIRVCVQPACNQMPWKEEQEFLIPRIEKDV